GPSGPAGRRGVRPERRLVRCLPAVSYWIPPCSLALDRFANGRLPVTSDNGQSASGRARIRAMALIGYARVSTEEQQTDPQLDELRAAGSREVFEERASGASRSRVELARCLERIGP